MFACGARTIYFLLWLEAPSTSSFFSPFPFLAGGHDALTVYLVDDNMVGPTPAPTPDTGGPQYGELGCAADFTTGVRVRESAREAGQTVGENHSSGAQARDGTMDACTGGWKPSSSECL